MKIFLQDCKTAKFIRCDSNWTLDRNEALDFLTVKRAVSFGMKELKDSFQVMQIEPDDLQGTVILAISNLRWPEAAQPVLSISLANGLPKPAVKLGNYRREQYFKYGKHPAIPLIMFEGCNQISATLPIRGREAPHIPDSGSRHMVHHEAEQRADSISTESAPAHDFLMGDKSRAINQLIVKTGSPARNANAGEPVPNGTPAPAQPSLIL
jgi:hypothetical protein